MSDVTERIIFENQSYSEKNIFSAKLDVSRFSKGVYFLSDGSVNKVLARKVVLK